MGQTNIVYRSSKARVKKLHIWPQVSNCSSDILLIFIYFHWFLQVFERWLLDAEWSLNAGNWMWLSCSAFFQQFFNCICPVGFGRKLDPNGDYVRLVQSLFGFLSQFYS